MRRVPACHGLEWGDSAYIIQLDSDAARLSRLRLGSASVFYPFVPVKSFLVAKVSMRVRLSRGDVDRVVT